ncbi:MAG: hypothetical protein RR627_07250, partial [Niameybacter sp.]
VQNPNKLKFCTSMASNVATRRILLDSNTHSEMSSDLMKACSRRPSLCKVDHTLSHHRFMY